VIYVDYLKIGLTSILAFAAMFLLEKIMGGRQISQMTMLDYVTGITIGSIAAELATELEEPLKPLLAMGVFGVVVAALNLLTNKSAKLRKIISGQTLVLLDGGVLYRESFRSAKLDLNEFMTAARANGYFDISQIRMAMMEVNGSISFLPEDSARPLTPNDMNIQPTTTLPETHVILDGRVMKHNLRLTGKDENWLNKQLSGQGYKSPKEVFLATCRDDNSLSVYPIVKSQAKEKS